MFSRSLFHHRQFALARFVVLCARLLITLLAVFKTSAPRGHASSNSQSLSFEDRVAAQRAIEAVYHRQHIWSKDKPLPKPALNEVLLDAALRAKVEEYLRISRALEVFTGVALTPEQLQAELERMARQTQQPEALDRFATTNDAWPVAVLDLNATQLIHSPVNFRVQNNEESKTYHP